MKTGLMIVLLGTDGSGKTTIINELPQYFIKKNIDMEISYYHWRPGYFIKKKTNIEGSRVENPHAKPAYGKIKSYIKFMIINLDYLLGYLFKVKKEINDGKLVIFDRYYYDYYLDKLRYRLSLEDKVIKLFQFMIPKPDITFLLIGTPETLYERKKEVSMDEIRRQINCMKKNKTNIPKSIYIDVDKDIDKVIDEIGSMILLK